MQNLEFIFVARYVDVLYVFLLTSGRRIRILNFGLPPVSQANCYRHVTYLTSVAYTLDNFSLQKVDDNDIAPVSYLKILDFHLEDKPDVEQLAEKPAVIEIPPEYRLDIPDRL